MPARKLAAPKEPLADVHVTLTPGVYVSLKPDDPRLAGRTYVGETLEVAFANARRDAQHFYRERANVTLSIKE